jgi:hypothetical protein
MCWWWLNLTLQSKYWTLRHSQTPKFWTYYDHTTNDVHDSSFQVTYRPGIPTFLYFHNLSAVSRLPIKMEEWKSLCTTHFRHGGALSLNSLCTVSVTSVCDNIPAIILPRISKQQETTQMRKPIMKDTVELLFFVRENFYYSDISSSKQHLFGPQWKLLLSPYAVQSAEQTYQSSWADDHRIESWRGVHFDCM